MYTVSYVEKIIKGTVFVTCNPRLADLNGKLNFREKNQSTQLRIPKPSKEHPRGPPKFPKQNLRQISQGILSYDREYENTDKQKLLLYIFTTLGTRPRPG